jgi:hypothetical protein
MKNNTVELPSEYEAMINKLENQITELFSEIHYYQALLTEKENTIIRLTTENRYLKAKVQTDSSQFTPPPPPPEQLEPSTYPNQKPYTPPPSPPERLEPPAYSDQQLYTKPPSPPLNTSEDIRVNKRVCPKCGAMGFAIKELDDKSRVLSYTPHRIYAKKYACTKCRYEWH